MKCQMLDNSSPRGFKWHAIKSLIMLENEHTKTHKQVGELLKIYASHRIIFVAQTLKTAAVWTF